VALERLARLTTGIIKLRISVMDRKDHYLLAAESAARMMVKKQVTPLI